MRMGAPPTFLMMMLLNSTCSTRPSVRTPSSVGPRTMRPPGVSTFSLRSARSTS
jgi:hypothetical protein